MSGMTRTGIIKDFYCSQKFTWLTVDLERRSTYSCCSATPEKINFEWLKSNPGEIFNTPQLQEDRQLMLNNIATTSCNSCWQAESDGLSSRRIMMKTDQVTHTDVQVNTPETLNIILGSTCNLTCSYCCKEYSNAWLRDISANGPYLDDQRFNLTPQDRLIAKLGQNEHRDTPNFILLKDEILKLSNVKQIIITGGEPLLYNYFIDFLNTLLEKTNVVFFTGLGVNPSRFVAQLEAIKNKSNLKVMVSAENCNEMYEFNRYGNSYTNFITNLDYLKNNGFEIRFSSVVSNLTIHDFANFWNMYQSDHYIKWLFCNDPDFLRVNILDNETKDRLCEELEKSNLPFKQTLIQNIQVPCDPVQAQNFKTYIRQFAQRRNITLDIFPESMVKWVNEDTKDQ